jgi:hypothetical protein
MSTLFEIASSVSDNWYLWCHYYPELNPKCPSDPSLDYFHNLYLLSVICDAMTYCLYHIAHFLFAYRYFEVAEMFGRKDKTMDKHIQARKVTSKISYVVIVFITINYLIYISNWINWRINSEYSN